MKFKWDWEDVYSPKRITFKNIENQRFGRLIAKYPIHRNGGIYWVCLCDCGNETIVKTSRLGNTKSCGCLQKEMYRKRSEINTLKMNSYVGKKIGNFIILGFYRDIDTNRLFFDCLCNCLCNCGNRKLIDKRSVLNEQTKSCGCLRKLNFGSNSNWRGYENIPSTYYSSVKNSAIKRDIEFNISIENMWEVFYKQLGKCAISGIDISLTRNKKGNPVTASLDRIDSTKGYILDNIQWVHKHINIMKNSQSMCEFIYICKKITDYQEYLRRNIK